MNKDTSYLILYFFAIAIVLLLKTWAFMWLWNSFLIDWAGLSLPIIGFGKSFITSLIFSYCFGSVSAPKRK